MKRKGLAGAAVFLAVPLVLQGCGFGSNGSSEDMDAPPEGVADEIEWESFEDEALEESGEEQSDSPENGDGEQENDGEMIERELYLLDEDGMVVPQTFELPKTKSALNQALEYLVADGPLTSMLPNGFQAVLPPGTEVDVHLDDGTAIADFSPEFRDYDPKLEQSILQAITWTLTQFDNVDEVRLRINGYEQDVMPANNTPIGESYSRENGINLENGSVTDITSSDSVTIYFLSQTQGETYYVPVTRRVENSEEKKLLDIAMEEMLKGPAANSTLHGVFREGASLNGSAELDGGTASVFFNEALLTEQEGSTVSEETLHAITLTAAQVADVEYVNVNVEGAEEVIEVSSDSIYEPVAQAAVTNDEPPSPSHK